MKISRLIATAGITLAGSLFGGTAMSAEPAEITFFIWAGSNQGVVPTEVIQKYQQTNPNVKINILESNNTITYPKMVAAYRTTPDKPLVNCGFFNVDSITKGDVEELWAPLDPKRVTNLTNIEQKYARPENKGVPYMMSGIGILYNKNAVKEPPKSWAEMWDPKFRGRVTMFDYDNRMLVIAAKLNGGGEDNIDPGFKVWSENAKNFRALVDSNDAVKNLLVSGDAWVAPWFSGLSYVWMREGSPLGFAIPKEGTIGFPLYLAMVKGGTPAQQAVCEDLLNELMAPANAGRYAKLTFAVPLLKNAELDEEQKKDPLLNAELAASSIALDYNSIALDAADWRERWDREVKFKLR
jgi:putative spermidine/putrescine transport system substrate-binding protein